MRVVAAQILAVIALILLAAVPARGQTGTLSGRVMDAGSGETIANAVVRRARSGSKFSIIVVSEGALPIGGAPTFLTGAAGLAQLSRSAGRMIAPAFAGAAMQAGALWLPLVCGASIKIVSDLLMWRAFRKIKPPEEA